MRFSARGIHEIYIEVFKGGIKVTQRVENQIRIIGGTLRGRKVHFPDLRDLRPTTDRIRETLFNWLMRDIPGAKVLDLFAGSGALGIEALSRGADQVVFVEKSKAAMYSISTHLQSFRIDPSRYQLHPVDALDFLSSIQGQAWFGLIFLDPPFADPQVSHYLEAVLPCLSPGGKIYLEQSTKAGALDLSAFNGLKDQTAGEVRYRLLERKSS
jgi:16S rRNA (guanine966-N2)-methyltransferase